MKFEFDQTNKLIRLNIEGNVYILDTGSQLSISLNPNVTKVNINDMEYPLINNERLTTVIQDALSHLIPNVKVDGLIGNDIISQTNLTLNYLDQEVTFGLVDVYYEDIGIWNLPIILRDGYIYTNFYLGNNKLEMILDSGASISYVKEKYVNKNHTWGDYNDYSPMLGNMTGTKYGFYESYHKENWGVGILPRIYEPYCDGIISVYDFCLPGFIRFDFEKKRMTFSRRFL